LDYTNAKDPHIGFALKNALENDEFISAKIIDGKYFDCGTPLEYITMIKEVMTF
jgi:UTP-glucose-1-phosphate uridylyltransferase